MIEPNYIDRPRIRVTPDGRVDAKTAAIFTGYTEKTLANWRSSGVGPRWRKVRRSVFHQLADLQEFVSGNAA